MGGTCSTASSAAGRCVFSLSRSSQANGHWLASSRPPDLPHTPSLLLIPSSPPQVRLAQRPGQPAAYRVLGRCPAGSAPPAGDATAVAAFFNHGDEGASRLADLHAAWADPADRAFAAAAAAAPGARVLDQDPLETLLAFICSSNNSIGRIAGMVAHLATAYGDELPMSAMKDEANSGEVPSFPPPPGPFHAFPTLEALAGSVTEADLRAAGFGYRAKYVAGTVAALAGKPGGGEAWLAGLRDPAVPAADAVAALETLPGVGPKVAACVALFALRKPGVVPVDTHVWKVRLVFYVCFGGVFPPGTHPPHAFSSLFFSSRPYTPTHTTRLPAVSHRSPSATTRPG